MDLLAKAKSMRTETKDMEEAIEEVKKKPKQEKKKPKINRVSLSVKKKTPIVKYPDGSEEKIPVDTASEVIEEIIDNATVKLKKLTEKVKVKFSKKPKPAKKPSGTSKIIGLVGEHGTGKTFSAASFGKNGRVLYFDSERKAHIVINENFPDYEIDVISFRQVDGKGRIAKLKTVKYFEQMTPEWRKLLASGDYDVCVIDNVDVLRPYAKYEWLRRNPKRSKPQSYEWGDIEEIVQDLLYPFINDCRDYDVILILCFGTKDAYLNDVIIGTGENMKQWLLGELDVEIWLDRDYQKYCIKHPSKPYWQYRDEGEFLVDYIFDKDFINEHAEFKTYNDFKEESLMSDVRKNQVKQARKNSKIQLK